MIAVVTFQGFTENLEWETGTERLYQGIIREFSGPAVTTAWPVKWNADVKGLAAFCLRQGFREVIVIGYSWGAGYAAPRFCAQLAKHGVEVPQLLLCDPVYRPRWLPAWLGAFPLAFRALLPGAKVKIPGNVRRVAWVRQTQTLPKGHDLVAEEERTVIEPALVLRQHSHTTIDNALEWRGLVHSKLKEILGNPRLT